MFRGSSTHKLDPKGRVSIPARFRGVMDSQNCPGLMLSRMDQNIVAYTYGEWEQIEKRILSLAEKSDAMRRFRRVFVGGAHDCPLDSQGRILIPPSLRQYAGLTKNIVLVGVLDHFEILSEDQWAKETEQLENDMQNEESLRAEIARLGL
ncbi:division/cell wall cluster transcriptional repressor MraZ [Desulfobotulus sp. H1]|uniref:Transcriptional regulator MraZ n=1 Tax=Desulfobotulus pelophilus TaxID=2823377 RepID=A0ABT3N533_9BACT|nr:division/cell wall cluster transcriptional repressor MraZ [Desulfobotulus pelophilus]MCW7752563.1 division/cell wall cluster transcriptional repressor MraZ [Desulfobotulus pelophilus]